MYCSKCFPRRSRGRPTLDRVLAICSGSGAKNGGIMLDNLHLQRTGTPPQDIVRKIPRGLPLGVEINDGMLATPVNFLDSVVNKRLLPGDGEFDIDVISARVSGPMVSTGRSASKC